MGHGRLLPRPFQPKLLIGEAGDPLERQADALADHVMRMPVQRRPAAPRISSITTSASAGAGLAAPSIVHETLRSPGQPLDVATRAFFEPRFGMDFSQVRLHTGSIAAQSTRAIEAKAYTVGSDIVFGAGHYSPSSTTGQRLLAHELVHTVQQGSRIGAPSLLMLQRQVDDPRPLRIHSVETDRRVYVAQWLDTPGDTPTTEKLYWVDFEVDKDGVMRASVRTVSPDRKYRSGQLRFGEEFRRALKHFEDNGIEIKEFEGDWSYMTEKEISENLNAFKEGMGEGLTREKAASQTPTGKVVARSGFEVTQVENVSGPQGHLSEPRWHVKAKFRRISAPAQGGAPGGGGTSIGKTAGAKEPVRAGVERGTNTGEAAIEPVGPEVFGPETGALAEEGLGAEALGAEAAGEAGLGPRTAGLTMVLGLLAEVYLYGSLADSIDKLKKMHARYEKKRQREIQQQLIEAANNKLKDRAGRILKACWIDQLKAAEKARKQTYAQITLKVQFANIGSDSPPKSIADLVLNSTEFQGVEISDHAGSSTATPLKDTGEKEFVFRNELWEQVISFSVPAPSAAELEKQFGDPADQQTCAESKGCFIATACYGTSEGKELDVLRAFRDEVLLRLALGRSCVRFYYRHSPPLAGWLGFHPRVRAVLRDGLITPLVRVIEPFVNRT